MEEELIDLKDHEGFEDKPQFLNVLCIMTFIATGLTMLASLFLLMSSSALGEFQASGDLELAIYNSYEGMMSEEELSSFVDSMNVIFQRILPIALVVFFAALLRFVGAFLMYRMNKIGFHLYTSGQILRLAMPVLIGISALFYPSFSSMIFAFAIPLMMVVFYGINIKIIKA